MLGEGLPVFNNAINNPEVRERMHILGIQLLGGTPEEFGRHIRAEMDRWGAVLRKAGVKPEPGR